MIILYSKNQNSFGFSCLLIEISKVQDPKDTIFLLFPRISKLMDGTVLLFL